MLLALFLNAFLAASLWPLSVEPLYIFSLGIANPSACLIVASMGNTLGSIFTFCIARYLPKREKWLKRLGSNSRWLQSIQIQTNRFGHYTAILCWLPILGDLIALALGFSKSSAWKSFVFMALGKTGRFAIISAIYFQMF